MDKSPAGAAAFMNDFYVDDCLTGADSAQEAIHIREELVKILRPNRFNLRKWCSNNDQLLHGIPKDDVASDVKFEDSLDSYRIKTLGLIWMPKKDQLCGRAQSSTALKITKRVVCSDLAQIFDFLGLFAPVVVKAKIFMQRLWEDKLEHSNSFYKLQRIVAYMLRFCYKRYRATTTTLCTKELSSSRNLILWTIQQAKFPADRKMLQRYNTVDRKSSISSLSPVLGSDGLMRVGGRLEQAPLPYNAKHNNLLPYNDPIVKMLLRCCQHYRHLYDELQMANVLMQHTRKRRSPFDAVGNIANSLFGVLDSNYANEMTKVIKKVQTNEEFVLSLLKNQTSVLDSTINVVKKTRATSDKRLRLLEQQVAAIAESRGKYTGSRLTETYLALTTQLTLLAATLQRMQSEIVDVLTGFHHHTISAILVSADQLKNQFDQKRVHLPPNQMLPVTSSNDQFMGLTHDDLRRCLALPNEEYICFDHQAVFKVNNRYTGVLSLSSGCTARNFEISISTFGNIISQTRQSYVRFGDIVKPNNTIAPKIKIPKYTVQEDKDLDDEISSVQHHHIAAYAALVVSIILICAYALRKQRLWTLRPTATRNETANPSAPSESPRRFTLNLDEG
ncbi:hypothetical protein ACLKA6_018807 [Drosophila palustris]